MSLKDAGMRRLTAAEAAGLLAAFVDILIPGDEFWPSASVVGVQGVLALRLSEEAGETGVSRLIEAILDAGGPLAGKNADEARAVATAFEATEPALFDKFRNEVTLIYYENTFVVEAIRQLGRPYKQKPHLTGYPLPKFDPERDRPTHNRGAYRPADKVRPLDISGLNLDQTRTGHWGLER
jgi:hypothetical protein